ncbi:recombination regulator RecX [Variovorax ureilyticus]|uniref:recombination regulator RecX n=1 Tax=Variovorax ureilyticus TaxID=1836198 RepID=UPI003D668C4B
MTSKTEEGRAGPSLKGRALRLLSQREHSRAELEQEAAQVRGRAGALARALDELTAKDFISEARVVQSVLHQRAARLGATRVRQELLHKGIAPEAVADAVASLQETELDRALAVWRRRFDAPPQDAAERARQMRFMMARGFATGVIAKVLRYDPDEE